MYRGKRHKNPLNSENWSEGKAERLIERGLIEEDPNFKKKSAKPKNDQTKRTAGSRK
jgi:hypothetical protein